MQLNKPLLLGTTVVASSLLFSACVPGLNQLLNRDAATETVPTSQQSTASQMMAALQSGQSLKCLVTSTEDNQNFEYYLKGDKFRMDGMTTVDGQTQTSHAINDSAFIYTWTDEQNQGVKMKMPTAEELAAQAEQYQEYANKYPDLTDETVVKQYEDQGYAIKCDPTSVSDDQFVPPSNVQFQDLSAMVQAATKMMKEAPNPEKMSPEQAASYREAMKLRGQ